MCPLSVSVGVQARDPLVQVVCQQGFRLPHMQVEQGQLVKQHRVHTIHSKRRLILSHKVQVPLDGLGGD